MNRLLPFINHHSAFIVEKREERACKPDSVHASPAPTVISLPRRLLIA
jgi:hypothetical protein